MNTYQTATDTFNAINEEMISRGMRPLVVAEMRDYNITEGWTYEDVRILVNDIADEEHSARCEAKDAWRYEL